MTASSRLAIGLVGATGRMGTRLQDLLERDSELGRRFELVWAVSGPKDPNFLSLPENPPQVIIDFSSPTTTLELAKLCAQRNVPLLVATTGFTAAQKTELKTTLQGKRWTHVPNTSPGVAAMIRIAEVASAAIPAGYQVSLTDVHHAHKKDAPSGTAKAIRDALAKARPDLAGLPIHSVREGEVVGYHALMFEGPEEKILIAHQALDRDLFARGALEQAQQLVET